MRAILGERNFLLFWTASAASLLGDWILWAALPFAIYRLTGSALAAGAMFMVQTVPALVLGSVAGVFVDRWERKRVVVAADLACAALISPCSPCIPATRSGSCLSSDFFSPVSGSSSSPPAVRTCHSGLTGNASRLPTH